MAKSCQSKTVCDNSVFEDVTGFNQAYFCEPDSIKTVLLSDGLDIQ